jgi:glycosyltransferase involved in cell wall biosynthesis
MNVSVVIPHYEKQKEFVKTWRALAPQLEKRDELIIVDDNSPNGFPDLVEDTSCKNIRFETLPKLDEHIYRLCTVRNKGVEEATYDAVIILDPDCIPNPKFIRNAKKVFDKSVLYSGFIDYLKRDGTLKKKDVRRAYDNNSRWVDRSNKGCGEIWGGCMMFSKSRTSIVGWFDPLYDGEWGAEESDFASRCYHSGMRLRHERGLQVFHQDHDRSKLPSLGNRRRWKRRMKIYQMMLDTVTGYRPDKVLFVNISEHLDDFDVFMQGLFRKRRPLKVCLIHVSNQDYEKIYTPFDYWRPRWVVDNIRVEDKQELRNKKRRIEAYYHSKGYECVYE